MDEVYRKITSIVISGFGEFFQNIPKILNGSGDFFKNVEDTENAFVKASLFGLIVATLTSLLSIPSYKINNVFLDPTFLTLDIVLTWILLVIYGFQIWVVSRLFLGKGGLLKSISAFFYASVIMIFGKLVEIPARIVRDNELLNGGLAPSTAENSKCSPVSIEIIILVGYLHKTG